jgi:peptide/nickel transport system substrate-binding protein
VGACGGSGSTSRSRMGGPVGSGTPRRGGTIRIGTEAEENGIDPTRSDFDTTGVMYARAFYDPLAATTSDGKVAPYLAESIGHNQDYTEWTITARQGVYFHDGEPFDANAILANFQAQLSSPISGQALSAMVSDVAVVGPMEVKVIMKSPWVPFDTFLCGWIGGQFAYMASPRAIAAGSLANHPVGTGPFVFEEWVPNDHLSGTRNQNYWRRSMPYVDAVRFHPIPDDQVRLDALEAGDIDIMHVTDVAHYFAAKSKPGFTSVDNLHGEVGEPDQDFIMLNLEQPPLDDLRVRQALAYALDTRTYNQYANEGVTPVDLSAFAQGSPYYSAANYPAYDPSKARALVAEVERDLGGPVVIHLGDTTGTVNTNDMSAIASMWQKVGIRVVQDQILQDEYIVNAALGNYHAYSWRQFGATDPDQNYTWWISTNAAPVGKVSLNFARLRDPQIDAALKLGRESASSSARVEAYRTVGERINANVPYIWENRNMWAVVARPGLVNYDAYSLPDGGQGLGMKIGVFPIVNAWFEV